MTKECIKNSALLACTAAAGALFGAGGIALASVGAAIGFGFNEFRHGSRDETLRCAMGGLMVGAVGGLMGAVMPIVGMGVMANFALSATLAKHLGAGL